MRPFLFLISFVVLAILVGLKLPWYSLSILGTFMGVAYQKSLIQTFALFFIGGLIAWGGITFFIDLQNSGILSDRVGNMLGGLNGKLVILITAVVGGLMAGLGGMTGAALSELSRKRKKVSI